MSYDEKYRIRQQKSSYEAVFSRLIEINKLIVSADAEDIEIGDISNTIYDNSTKRNILYGFVSFLL